LLGKTSAINARSSVHCHIAPALVNESEAAVLGHPALVFGSLFNLLAKILKQNHLVHLQLLYNLLNTD